jgi:hypothetical protein
LLQFFLVESLRDLVGLVKVLGGKAGGELLVDEGEGFFVDVEVFLLWHFLKLFLTLLKQLLLTHRLCFLNIAISKPNNLFAQDGELAELQFNTWCWSCLSTFQFRRK